MHLKSPGHKQAISLLLKLGFIIAASLYAITVNAATPEINPKTGALVVKGNLYKDFLSLRSNCPYKPNVSLICKTIYFIPNNWPNNLKAINYQFSLKQISPGKLSAKLNLNQPDKIETNISFKITDIDQHAYKTFLSTKPNSISQLKEHAYPIFHYSKLTDFNISANIKWSPDIQQLILHPSDLNWMFNEQKSNHYPTHIHIMTSHKKSKHHKRIQFESDINALASLDGFIDFYIDGPVYLLPILKDLALIEQDKKSTVRNYVYINQIHIAFINKYLIENLLVNIQPGPIHLLLIMASEQMRLMANNEHHRHPHHFLLALSDFIRHPNRFNINIETGHSLYNIENIWHYIAEYINAKYDQQYYLKQLQATHGSIAQEKHQQAKKEATKHRILLYQLYLEDIAITYK